GDNSDNTHENFRSRIVLYLTDLFAKQDKQKVYSEYKNTYCVAFCDYTIWKNEQFFRKFYLTEFIARNLSNRQKNVEQRENYYRINRTTNQRPEK
ncbi:MAG: hypothetical protein LBM93_09750, partial [Oscillospiraceae bacterium]|nr:hypothetical protein [Oscillospiraceae bacterium]